jgi:hypothetical protein
MCLLLWLAVLAGGLLRAQSAPSAPAATVPPGGSSAITVFGGTSNFEAATRSAGTEVASVHQAPNQSQCDNKRHGEIAVAPVPMINPTIGYGLGVGVLYLVNFDPCVERVKPSVFAIGGMATNNGSWGLAGGTSLVLREDRYRVAVGGGGGVFNYKFFGIGNNSGSQGASIGISQRSKGFLIEPKMRVARRWYIGPRYHILTNKVSLDPDQPASGSPDQIPQIPTDDVTLKTAALGLRVQNDTRDNTFYPRSGSFADATLDFYDAAFGGRHSYRNLALSYSYFLGFGKKNVLAMHGSLCASWNGAPFYDLCLLGMSEDLRGYEIGRYRDQRFLSAQVEYRRELFWRVGAVAFIGAGEVGKTFTSFNASDILPGGGAGLRFTVAKKNHVNLRGDYAWGRGSHGVYIGITEAF